MVSAIPPGLKSSNEDAPFNGFRIGGITEKIYHQKKKKRNSRIREYFSKF